MPTKTNYIWVRLTEEQELAYKSHASSSGKPLAVWVRDWLDWVVVNYPAKK